jgi:adenylylsulfate kinase
MSSTSKKTDRTVDDNSKYLVSHDYKITRQHREAKKNHQGLVVWFTGLSGSGKSTLANALELALYNKGMHTYILDGDNVRQGLNKDLDFSESGRTENIRRIAEVAALMMDAGLVVITAFISPFEADRKNAKAIISDKKYFEVYVETSLHECERRDVKGLYKKAREGIVKNMTGISSPYDIPQAPNYIAKTELHSIDEIISDLVRKLESELNA